MWAPSSPHDGIEVTLSDKKILVWCAISEKFIFGPYFFTAKRVQEWFESKMADKFLNKKILLPRSPDLNSADSYLWVVYLKAVVYNPTPKTLEDLMANIKREINKFPKSVLKIIYVNFEKWCHLVVTAEGEHIE